MTNELQNNLVKKHPEFFDYLKSYEGPMMPIQFGFECGDGWYWLISNLMDTIYSYCKNNKKEIPTITQIKEKYGELCFYYNGGDELIDGMVWFAENLSLTICETCGSTENVGMTQGWIKVVCENCLEEKDKYNWKRNEEK